MLLLPSLRSFVLLSYESPKRFAAKTTTFCPPARVKTSTKILLTSDREPLGPKGTDTLIFYQASSHQELVTFQFQLWGATD